MSESNTPTPRTDSIKERYRLGLNTTSEVFMHVSRIERELAAANEKIAQLEREAIAGLDPTAPVEELRGAKPVVLYFATEEDREGFIQDVQSAIPTMKARKL